MLYTMLEQSPPKLVNLIWKGRIKLGLGSVICAFVSYLLGNVKLIIVFANFVKHKLLLREFVFSIKGIICSYISIYI